MTLYETVVLIQINGLITRFYWVEIICLCTAPDYFIRGFLFYRSLLSAGLKYMFTFMVSHNTF